MKAMSKPRTHWASDPNKYKSGVYTSKKVMEGQIEFIEKSAADQLAEALERITNYPKYYASSLSNGFLDSSKTIEGQFETVKNIAKQALKNYQEGE